MKNALVIGATGITGRLLLEKLSLNPSYKKVVVLHYREIDFSYPKQENHIVDFNELHLFKLNDNIDEVYCCLGTTIKKAKSKEQFRKVDYDYVLALANWAKSKGVESFSVISSLGANENSSSFYLKVKGQMEQGLLSLGFRRLFIFRPAMLFGAKRKEFRFGEVIGIAVMKLFNPLMLGWLKAYKMVNVHQRAKIMIDWNQKPVEGNVIVRSEDLH